MASRLARSNLFQKFKNAKFQKRNYGGDHHLTKLEVDLANRNTLDLLPQPKGSWEELNSKRQAVNNAFLGVGTIVFLSSIFGTISLGYWGDVYFKAPYNDVRPDFPGARFSN